MSRSGAGAPVYGAPTAAQATWRGLEPLSGAQQKAKPGVGGGRFGCKGALYLKQSFPRILESFLDSDSDCISEMGLGGWLPPSFQRLINLQKDREICCFKFQVIL